MVQRMSLIANRRSEKGAARRILDAAKLSTLQGWDAVTVDKVARSARCRARWCTYIRDKEELLFGIVSAHALLRERF